ncbi:LysM peptidoglycan-binding domain-containing protein [Actinoplanes auranticolor]|uniref:LysM domain-containing protein n=1 Tax=Actinoplanes auranticolor TaxID=47988 RepID=A0A919SI15_9ACTN|nr:LysM peptidoglycan-binding domain-containing protein [Actinoplanes auranticolor]GIM72111.1 hypothetical protein Aau02nite_49260 [Actinoplanes auranticolor]
MIRLMAAIRTTVAVMALLAAVPLLLAAIGGSPLPDRTPSSVEIQNWLDDPMQPQYVAATVKAAAWVIWALLAAAVLGVMWVRVRRWRWARLAIYLPGPVQGLAATLLGAATVTTAVGVPQPHTAAPAAAQDTVPPSPTTTVDVATVSSTAQHHSQLSPERASSTVTVRHGDTLWDIAAERLGSAHRWKQLYRLNTDRYPGMRGGDHIEPGWTLTLPARAAKSAPTPARPGTVTPNPAPPDAASTIPPPSRPAAPQAPHPGTTTSPAGHSATAPTNPHAELDNSANAPSSAANANETGSDRHRTSNDLVLPGSVIPQALAAAITATAALVWIQRRRRYRYHPGIRDDQQNLHDVQPLPAPVRAAQRHTRHATAPTPPQPPLHQVLPSGGVGLIGPGANDAARGLIITALTAGAPTDPDQRAEVVTDRQTLAALMGDPPVTGWPRLHIAESLDQALTLIETHLLHRARVLDEHGLADLDTVRMADPSEEALPPLLLITDAGQAIHSTRARITFGLTRRLDVTVVVVGHWPHGPAIGVSPDGEARLGSEDADADTTQLAVLDVATTRDLLTTVREAHTGEPSSVSSSTSGPATSADSASATEGVPEVLANASSSASTTIDTAAPTVTERARLRVLGSPHIEDITADGRPLRAKALEMAVFLAVHPDGASTRDIGEYLEPDARISQADQRVHTNASNLRHVLGRAGTAETKNAYVIKSAGRYRLDPATVDVDVWTLRELMRSASIATQARRRELLTAACDLYTAPLAEGQDYEWVQPHRETVRRWGTEAHLMLADDLLDDDPQAASGLLDKAINLDRYNEALYTKAMLARHALGDADGIRTLLRALTKALADLDAEPQEDTIELAQKLRNSLDDK